jgi:hypothetical protein
MPLIQSAGGVTDHRTAALAPSHRPAAHQTGVLLFNGTNHFKTGVDTLSGDALVFVQGSWRSSRHRNQQPNPLWTFRFPDLL